jgi:hypothetical protein
MALVPHPSRQSGTDHKPAIDQFPSDGVPPGANTRDQPQTPDSRASKQPPTPGFGAFADEKIYMVVQVIFVYMGVARLFP